MQSLKIPRFACRQLATGTGSAGSSCTGSASADALMDPHLSGCVHALNGKSKAINFRSTRRFCHAQSLSLVAWLPCQIVVHVTGMSGHCHARAVCPVNALVVMIQRRSANAYALVLLVLVDVCDSGQCEKDDMIVPDTGSSTGRL